MERIEDKNIYSISITPEFSLILIFLDQFDPRKPLIEDESFIITK